MKLPGLPLLIKGDLFAVGSGFFALIALSGVVSFFANAKYSEVRASQPIAFDHRLHVEDEGLECSACHMYYERESFSGLPRTNTCALCHFEPQGESAEEEKLVQLIQDGAALEWASLFRQPPHVFFSHRRHVVVAGIECTTCHGDIGLSEEPPAATHPLTMDECITCHEEQAVTQNCASCHR